MADDFADLRRWEHSAADRTLSVYTLDQIEAAPPVVLLHELPGLSKQCLRLARDLHVAGFSVHMPLLFGRLGQGSALKGVYQMWCLRGEFQLLRNGRTSRISGWIRSLCDEVGSGEGTVGVVGMCATGGLIMSVMYQPSVGAAVSAQPALPFRLFYTARSPAHLGASLQDVERSAASATPLMASRFRRDPICPPNRVAAMEDVFTKAEFVRREGPGWRHATLTLDAERSGAVPDVIDFLQRHLHE